jgi:hypothetical protein
MIDAVYILCGLAIVLGVAVVSLPLALAELARRSAVGAVRRVVWGTVV